MFKRSLVTQNSRQQLKVGIVSTLAFSLVMVVSNNSWGQSQPTDTGGAPSASFELIEVTTGSGSKTQAASNQELKIEVPAPIEPAGSSQVTDKPVVNAGDAGKEVQPAGPESKEGNLLAALEQWHYQTLASYDCNILSLGDPFMPIKAVRGNPDEKRANEELALNLPPLLRLELNQLKLVAITILSDRSDGALASFEDGAGASYILRPGERIGRNNGKILKIEQSQVTVEETGRSGKEAPTITVIKLNVTKSDGLTRGGDVPEAKADSIQ